MEGDMHKAAMAHYAHLSMDEKQKVLRSFEEKDANQGPARFCDACGSIVWGVYFVCVECYYVDKEKSYDLCCSCYHKKNFSHVHSYFLDTNALLRKIQCEDIKGKMEEMREVAMAYYAKLPNDQKQLVWSFFKTLDGNGDGKVSIQEYSDFVKETGRSKFLTPNLFKLLDKDDDGTLDFEECVTLFYMDKGHRLLLCDGCRSHILGIHFICVECYNVGKGTYDLCSSCYRNNNFNHVHSFFLDNYALLRAKPWEDNTSAAVASYSNSDNTPAVVKSHSKRKELEENIRGFETGVRLVKIVHDAAVAHPAAVHAVATNCTVM